MRVKCLISKDSFEVSDGELELREKMGLPAPRISPEERQRRRLAFRNFRHLYRRSCSKSAEPIISMYTEDAPFPVLKEDIWWSDTWNAKDHGLDFDFSKPFFDQYKTLSDKVPREAILVTNSENCQYTNLTANSKDCYLVFGCVGNEHCLYGHIVWRSEYCVDNLYLYNSQWCSNCTDVLNSYDLHYSTECSNCQESYFLYDCRNCLNCFCCTNLRNKQYCFQNEQLSKKEYNKRLAEIRPFTNDSILHWEKELLQMKKEFAYAPEIFGERNENVSGNHIYESQELHNCFDVKRSEHMYHCYTVDAGEYCSDFSFSGTGGKFGVEMLTVAGPSQEIVCSHWLQNCSNASYSEFCYSSNDIFGCNGLRNESYCILNKQYQKEDYFELRDKIIEHMKYTGEWGEYFPVEFSPFAYNESIAAEYLPLSRSEVENRGWRWKDLKEKPKEFRITRAEEKFYERTGLPAPEQTPEKRHLKRMQHRAKRSLQEKNCAKCQKRILTGNTNVSEMPIYCEPCYQSLVAG